MRRSKLAQRRSGLNFGHFDYSERPLSGNRAAAPHNVERLGQPGVMIFAAPALVAFVTQLGQICHLTKTLIAVRNRLSSSRPQLGDSNLRGHNLLCENSESYFVRLWCSRPNVVIRGWPGDGCRYAALRVVRYVHGYVIREQSECLG